MLNIFYYNFPFCRLGLAEKDGSICRILFPESKFYDCFSVNETPLIKAAAAQLDEYFYGKRKTFDFPVTLRGTDFQISVWKALQEIPYGETRSYKELAAMAGNPKACRAAGMANNRNPIPIVFPCHRVIGSNGKLVGYAAGLELKQKLLELERLPVLGCQYKQ